MPNLYDHSEPGCLFTVLFGTLPLVLTYLYFVKEINPSFDVFNIFKVLIWHTVQEFVRVSFENNSFLCFDTLFHWLLSFPPSNLSREFAPPPKYNWFENNRKINITKEICITIYSTWKIPERKSDSETGSIFENFTRKQGNSLKILVAGTRNHGVSLPLPPGGVWKHFCMSKTQQTTAGHCLLSCSFRAYLSQEWWCVKTFLTI